MLTVFLIDDDDDDREIFSDALASLELEIEFVEAVNGIDAFEKLNHPEFKVPHIIFLDLNMPKMDGKEFLLAVKKDQMFKDIPVIIYSTSSNSADVEFTLSNQASHFMTKHHSIFELREQLMETLRDFAR